MWPTWRESVAPHMLAQRTFTLKQSGTLRTLMHGRTNVGVVTQHVTVKLGNTCERSSAFTARVQLDTNMNWLMLSKAPSFLELSATQFTLKRSPAAIIALLFDLLPPGGLPRQGTVMNVILRTGVGVFTERLCLQVLT